MRFIIPTAVLFLLATTGCPGPAPVDGGPAPNPGVDAGAEPDPVPTGAEGGICFVDNTCQDTLVCVDELCVRATEGAEFGPCYPNSTCDGALVCVDDTCIEDVVSVGDEGGACFANGTCNGALTCVDDICADGPQPGTEGGACLQNGGCNGDLTCQSDVCRQPLLPTIESFTATPSSITNGDNTTIEWTTANATSCTLTGEGDVAPNGSVSITPQITTTFTLSCQNADEAAESLLTVTVSTPVEILSFFTGGEAELQEATIDQGETLTLTWSARFATECSLTPTGDVVESAGSADVTPEADVVYVFECQGQGGPVSETISVTVHQPVTIVEFLVNGVSNTTTVDIGDSVDLTWAVTDAEGCSLQEVGEGVDSTSGVSPVGSEAQPATADRDFTLTCTGLQGPVSETLTIFVRPQVAITDFSTATPSITTGSAVSISYATENADTCVISNSLDATTIALTAIAGAESFTPPQSVAYTLTCEGSGGPVSQSLFIETLNRASIVSFSIEGNPSVVTYLETATFQWEVQDATDGCTITGPNTNLTAAQLGLGTVSAEVFIEADPGAAAEFRLTCFGDGGTDTTTIVIPVAQDFIGTDVRVCDVVGCGPTHTVAQLQTVTRVAGTLTIITAEGLTLPKLASVADSIFITVIDENAVGLPGLRYAESDINVTFTNSFDDSNPQPSGIVGLDRLYRVDGDFDVDAALAEYGLLQVPQLEIIAGSLAIVSNTCGLDYQFDALQRVLDLTLNPFSGPSSPTSAFPFNGIDIDGNLSISAWSFGNGAMQSWLSGLNVSGSSSFPAASAGVCQ